MKTRCGHRDFYHLKANEILQGQVSPQVRASQSKGYWFQPPRFTAQQLTEGRS